MLTIEVSGSSSIRSFMMFSWPASSSADVASSMKIQSGLWTSTRAKATRCCSPPDKMWSQDRKSTRLNSSHVKISYAVFCLKKKKKTQNIHSSKRKKKKKKHHKILERKY